MNSVLSIVVPCYNEEETLLVTSEKLGCILELMIQQGEVSPDSHICFVNDGSRDRTWSIIAELRKKSLRNRGVNLSRNFGHQAAVLAGLYTDKADVYITIDADLQDDATKIPDMIQLYHQGNDIVYGCREDRSSDTWFKRTTAQMFYVLREKMGCYTIPNHADYRLMSARAVKELQRYDEVNLYLRGVVPLLGFPSAKVYYTRTKRELGESKYPLGKMIKLAWNGIVNFSEIPLHICLWTGVVGILTSIALVLYCIVRWSMGETIPGWTSIVLIMCWSSSMQFLFMGIVGLYIGKIFMETKNRPRFIVQDDMTGKE